MKQLVCKINHKESIEEGKIYTYVYYIENANEVLPNFYQLSTDMTMKLISTILKYSIQRDFLSLNKLIGWN